MIQGLLNFAMTLPVAVVVFLLAHAVARSIDRRDGERRPIALVVPAAALSPSGAFGDVSWQVTDELPDRHMRMNMSLTDRLPSELRFLLRRLIHGHRRRRRHGTFRQY